MKQLLSVFLLFNILSANNLNIPTHIDDRSKLLYEITNVELNSNGIYLQGWAVLTNTQHFLDSNTHEIYIVLKNKSGEKRYKTTSLNTDITNLLEDRSFSKCGNKQYNSSNCNYQFKNVGFKAFIPLNEFNEDTNSFYVEVKAFQTQKYIRSSLFYGSSFNTVINLNNKEYTLQSKFKYVDLTVMWDNHVVRTGPSPNYSQLTIGPYCSSGYKNNAYFTQGSVFTNILDKFIYNNSVTYYKLGLKRSGCTNNRTRVVEEKTNPTAYGYIPSTAVNYSGVPLTLSVKSKYNPVLTSENAIIKQYGTYRPYDYVKGKDDKNNPIKNTDIQINHNVNTNIPGTYETCYYNQTYNLKTCSEVTVQKIPAKIRYISESSYPHLKNSSVWYRDSFINILLNAFK